MSVLFYREFNTERLQEENNCLRATKDTGAELPKVIPFIRACRATLKIHKDPM